MTDATAIRTTISSTLEKIGESITRTPRTKSFDKWGTITYSNGTTTSLYVAPDDYFTNEVTATDRGLLDNASLVVVTAGSNTVNNDDLLTIDSVDYVVLSVEDFMINGVVVGKQIILGEFNG